jgi:enoyl-CoA hydratase
MIEQFRMVVIAIVNGLALGGVCEVALACDIRVAEETTIFGFPEVGHGLIPGAGGTQRLSRLVSTGKAKDLILTGNPINLVKRVVSKRETLLEAKRIAEHVLLRGPIGVVHTKKAINEGFNMSFKDGLKRESQLFTELFLTQDKQERVLAFLEKRRPKFISK